MISTPPVENQAKISWKLLVVNIHRPFHIISGAPTFGIIGKPSSGEVYRYFAFIDPYKQAISMNKDRSITKELYNFTDSAQLWRIGKYISFVVAFKSALTNSI